MRNVTVNHTIEIKKEGEELHGLAVSRPAGQAKMFLSLKEGNPTITKG